MLQQSRQLFQLDMAPLLDKHYWNEGLLSGEKIPLKCFQSFFNLYPFASVSGFSNDVLYTPVVQETAKLSNVKVGGLKKILA